MNRPPAEAVSTARIVVLTFDYELYFGRSGTVERCLIAPVDLLLRELAAVDARACFFVDASYMLRMREEARAADDAARIREQVGRIVAAGHRVELHVHPQWLDAAWSGDGMWDFTKHRSCVLQELGQERTVDLMVSGADALSEAARAAQREYALEAFRAPGLCAQPFDAIAAGMKALGLVIDSSVAPGWFRDTATHSFDYRRAPADACWRFDADPLVPSPAGRFVELPISCTVEWLGTKIPRRIDMIARPAEYEAFGDGTWMPTSTRLGARVRKKLLPSVSTVSLEGTPPSVLRSVLSHAHDVVTFVSHPKAMSPVSFESLRWLAARGVRFALPAEVVASRCDANGALE